MSLAVQVDYVRGVKI